jgi:transcriptional regulator with XRE-family HTH domain
MSENRLKTLVLDASRRKGFSMRELAIRAEIKNHSQVSRALRGLSPMKREMLTKICNALESPDQERSEIFHAAGYLAPQEMEEVNRVAA